MEKDFVALLLLGFLSFRFSTFILKNISDFLKSKIRGVYLKKERALIFISVFFIVADTSLKIRAVVVLCGFLNEKRLCRFAPPWLFYHSVFPHFP